MRPWLVIWNGFSVALPLVFGLNAFRRLHKPPDYVEFYSWYALLDLIINFGMTIFGFSAAIGMFIWLIKKE